MRTLIVFALVAYIMGAAGYLAYMARHRAAFRVAGHAFFAGGLACHTAYIVAAFIVAGYVPVENLSSALGFGAWALALVFVVLQIRFRLIVLGALTAPLVSAALFAALAMPAHKFGRPDLLKSAWLFFHILGVFVGNGAFILAALTGAVYLVQERAIKAKNHGYFFRRLPSLDVLDRMGYACVALGFPMLSLGLVAGFVYAQAAWGRWWSWDPKEVWSLAMWLLYAALLHERLTVGWRGRRAAIMALAGLAVLLFTFFGAGLLVPGHHAQFVNY